MSDEQSSQVELSIVSGFSIKLILIAWLSMLGFDFFLHGGLLAGIYAQESPFLLSPLEAFRRIPIGYFSFLFTAALLVWLSLVSSVRSVIDGLKLGLGVGLIMWVSLGLGMYSITTARPVTLVAWAIGQALEMALAGAIIGLALREGSLRRAALIAILTAIVFVFVTIVLQSVGIVQAPRVL